MKTHTYRILCAGLVAIGLIGTVRGHTVNTSVGNGSDVQMSEQSTPAASNGDALNTRFSSTGLRNDVVGLRFDLSEYDLTTITNVSINVVNYRDNDSRYVAIYGLTKGASGGNEAYDTETWSDSLVSAWGDLPGLDVSDSDASTRSLDEYSGNLVLIVNETTMGAGKGTVSSYSSEELTTFVREFNGTNITFLITQGNSHESTGQFRFASKEAMALDGGSPSGAAGDFAPYLEFGLTTDAADTVAPSVVSFSPTNGAAEVDLDLVVEVTFDEAMRESSIVASNFYLFSGTNPVSATLSYSPTTLSATLAPDAFTIDGLTAYTVTLKGGAGGLADASGNPLEEDVVWSFTTRALTESDPVRVVVDADTYLTNGQNGDSGPETTHGTKSQWEVRWYDSLDGTSRIHIGYLRFDISAIDAASFQDVQLSGTFTSSSYSGPGTWEVYGLNDNVVSNEFERMGNDWNESTISFLNAAGISNNVPQGSFAFLTNETTRLGTITLNGSTESFCSDTNLNLLPLIAEDTDGLVTIMLMSETYDGREYRIDSKEGSSTGGHRPVTLDFYGVVEEEDADPVTLSISTSSGSSILVVWPGLSDHLYTVERTTDLGDSSGWVTVATNVPGDSATTYTEDPPAEEDASYRVIDEGRAP